MLNIDEELFKATANLREVTSVLRVGIKKSEFDQRYSSTYVSPYRTAHEFLGELRDAGGILEDGGVLKLKV